MNSTIEVYSPPYLFRGPRPSIRSAPNVIRHGQSFNVDTPEAESIRRVVLVRPMAVTHQTDTEQRVISLAFVRDRATRDRLVLTAPAAGAGHALAPSGYYMLFILNERGVPSVAEWIRLDSSMHAQPGATVTALLPFEGHVDLFASTADGTVMSTFFEGDHWRAWFSIHGETKMQPGATVTALLPFEGHVDLFASDGEGTILATYFEAAVSWQPWFQIL